MLPEFLPHLPLGKCPLPELVEIVAVSSIQIAKAHDQFMGDPRPTDVITFHHGEILVCPAIAREQASTHGMTISEELLFYILHGLLHLLGWEDGTKKQRDKMHREQYRLMRLFPREVAHLN